jgi:hypothetical protein
MKHTIRIGNEPIEPNLLERVKNLKAEMSKLASCLEGAEDTIVLTTMAILTTNLQKASALFQAPLLMYYDMTKAEFKENEDHYDADRYTSNKERYNINK